MSKLTNHIIFVIFCSLLLFGYMYYSAKKSNDPLGSPAKADRNDPWSRAERISNHENQLKLLIAEDAIDVKREDLLNNKLKAKE